MLYKVLFMMIMRVSKVLVTISINGMYEATLALVL